MAGAAALSPRLSVVSKTLPIMGDNRRMLCPRRLPMPSQRLLVPNPTFLRAARDSLRAAAAPSPKMYGTLTTRREEGVIVFPTWILLLNFRHEPGLLQSSAYTRRAPGNPCDALE